RRRRARYREELMRRHCIAIALFLLVAVSAAADDPADTHPDLHLVPWPKSLQRRAGEMRLGGENRIVAGDEQLRPLGQVLSDEIALLTGLKLPVVRESARAGDIVLKLNPALKAGEPILE